jgi:hypothetical protein
MLRRADCCFVEAVASVATVALRRAALRLDAPADRVTLPGGGDFRFAGRIQRCDAGVDADAGSPLR